MNMLTVIPYHNGDLPLVKTLLDWMLELYSESQQKASFLLVADSNVPLDEQKGLKAKAAGMARYVEAMNINVGNLTGHAAANLMFHYTSAKIQAEYKTPFLWLEPDCTPRHIYWLLAIENAYEQSMKRYLGCIVTNPNPVAPLPDRFLAGVAVYPHDAHNDLREFLKQQLAWDMAGAKKITPMAEHTPLIQHFHNPKAPVFKEVRAKDDPENVVTDDFVNKDAVLFHSCKDSSLIRLLRTRREVSSRLATQPQRKPNKKVVAKTEPEPVTV